MGRLFGTDGVRGKANSELTCELAFNIGRYGAYLLSREHSCPRILLGRDTRISGDMLLAALSAGICSAGADAVDIGVLPTPAVAYLTKSWSAAAGVSISASHNPFEDNGIKWFDSMGYKLPDPLEDEIEAMINLSAQLPEVTGSAVGKTFVSAHALEAYEKFLVSHGCDLSGVKIVLDCANGAASQVAPKVFEALGAEVYPHFCAPDGANINRDCGSTHMNNIKRLVPQLGADIGLAFDGDADRLLAVDEKGNLVDGDVMMAILAVDMKREGLLKKDTLVGTIMSNLGVCTYLKSKGIDVATTNVGDRYVLECIREKGYNLGGESSGHMIFADKTTTGDGILAALELLKVLCKSGESLSRLAEAVTVFPQVLLNVEVAPDKKYNYKADADICSRIAMSEKTMGGRGRVLVRTSGTEPLIRIMLEGDDNGLIQREALAIAQCVADKLGGKIR